ncbi:hypothetical protein WA026_014147 [Henosepilachna vigintioctopunctata]|uniref:Elongation of very long chain fatty acids protein n=1 Tax=Henosepilachna vigintioctopunctata TaxID=420089 RepID=A0AAW1TVE4_9CUCU
MNYIENIGFIYNQLFNDLADPRTNNWFMVRNPFPVFSIAIAYNFFVLGLGPKYMSRRKPFDLRKILILYNALQVLLSMYIFHDGFIAYLYRYSLRCEPVDTTWSEEAMRAARGCYIYYLAKVTELMDTVFFILRNKYDQVTFLHVYHHTIMPLISWGNVKYFPGGHGVFIGMINSFVNVIMYVYYMIAAMGPNYQKYIWWKKHITLLQMVQMGVTFFHSAQLLFIDCGYPRWTILFTMPNAILFIFLFNDFYKNIHCVTNKILVRK